MDERDLRIKCIEIHLSHFGSREPLFPAAQRLYEFITMTGEFSGNPEVPISRDIQE